MSSTKGDLLATLHRSWAEWQALLEEVGEARMAEPNVEGVWAVRDIIAHVTAYERWVATMVLAELKDETPTNFELYGCNAAPSETADDDEFNAWVVEFQRNYSIQQILSDNKSVHRSFLQAIESLSEDELKDPSRFTWLNGKSLWQILPNQSFQHYAMHMPGIRAWLANKSF